MSTERVIHPPRVTQSMGPMGSLITLGYRSLPANEKVDIILAMGFSPQCDPHSQDCPANLSSGYRCQCVPPATTWAQPHDVDVLRHETWDERLTIAKKRDKE